MRRRFADASPEPAAAWAEYGAAQPMGRLGTAEECAAAALWLVSPEASFVTGIAPPVDGGFTAMWRRADADHDHPRRRLRHPVPAAARAGRARRHGPPPRLLRRRTG